MEPEARAVAKLSRAASGFGYSRRHRAARHLPAPEMIDALLDYLVYGTGPEAELTAVLDVGEDLLGSREVRVSNLVSSVMLEKLQMLASYPDNVLSAEYVDSILGPRSRAAWREVDELWTSVSDDLAGRPANLSVSDYLKLASAQLRLEFRSTYRVMPYGSLVGVFDLLRWETGYRFAATAPRETDTLARHAEEDQTQVARGVA